MLLLLSILPLGVAVIMWLPDRELAGGPRVEADVLEVLSVVEHRNGIPETSSVRVRFITEAGESVTTTVRTTRGTFGRSIELTYNPHEPTTVRALDGPERAWRIPLILGGSMAGIGISCAWTAFRLGKGRPSRLYRRTADRFGRS